MTVLPAACSNNSRQRVSFRGDFINLHKATDGEYKLVRALYYSAFPSNERAPFFLIRRRALQNRATMLVAQNNGEFIGFAYTVGYNNLIYLFYFAVAEDKRSCGNGGEILRLLKAYYVNKTIFLAREPLDNTAENSQERIKRRSFYLRNGFFDLPFQIKEANVVFDLMSTDESLYPSDYNALVRGWAGKIETRFIKMELIE